MGLGITVADLRDTTWMPCAAFKGDLCSPLRTAAPWRHYTDELLESGVSLPVQRGEMNTIFEGCYTTHADIKRYNRAGENLLCTADTLSALAGIEARKRFERQPGRQGALQPIP